MTHCVCTILVQMLKVQRNVESTTYAPMVWQSGGDPVVNVFCPCGLPHHRHTVGLQVLDSLYWPTGCIEVISSGQGSQTENIPQRPLTRFRTRVRVTSCCKCSAEVHVNTNTNLDMDALHALALEEDAAREAEYQNRCRDEYLREWGRYDGSDVVLS